MNWESLIASIASGIASGILTAFVLRGWKTTIEPWWESVTYRGSKIEGTWYGAAIINGEEVHRRWEIKRSGHRIWAEVVSTKGKDAGQVFIAEGTINHLLLTAQYAAQSERSTARGTYFLKITHDGMRMEGVLAYHSSQLDRVTTGHYELRRDQSAPAIFPRSVQHIHQPHSPPSALGA